MKILKSILILFCSILFFMACSAEKVDECIGAADNALGPNENRQAVMDDRNDLRAQTACSDCCRSNGYKGGQTRMRGGDNYIRCLCEE